MIIQRNQMPHGIPTGQWQSLGLIGKKVVSEKLIQSRRQPKKVIAEQVAKNQEKVRVPKLKEMLNNIKTYAELVLKRYSE